MRAFVTLVLAGAALLSYGQPNCNVYTINGNDSCYQACVLGTEAAGRQGSRQSQEQFDRAIELCPTFDYAYFEKAVPYLKRGDFVTWKKLIDQAVKLNPLQHLGYRGWCRYQFLRDYEGAIKDIELLDSLTEYDIGYSINGDYHLQVARALCYWATDHYDSAITILKRQLATPAYSPMNYDYLHLGLMQMTMEDLDDAIASFNKSIALNDYLAENYYWLAMAYHKSGRLAEHRANLLKAQEFHRKGYRRFDPYTHPMHQVYLSIIEREIAATTDTAR